MFLSTFLKIYPFLAATMFCSYPKAQAIFFKEELQSQMVGLEHFLMVDDRSASACWPKRIYSRRQQH
jgi:hypothetical protein